MREFDSPIRLVSIQKPSVGRIVHYQADDEGPLAALVTRVNPDDTLELTFYYPRCPSTWAGNVKYAETPTVGKWSWPPRV